MKFTTTNKLVNYINSNIDEAEIFSKYLNIPISDIYKCINDKSYRINNPLRNDKNPSLGFIYVSVRNKNKLYAKDFANPFYVGDCYYFVGIVLGLHCNIPRDFVNICKNIIQNHKTGNIRVTAKSEPIKIKQHNITTIDVEKRTFDKYDLAYWNTYGITKNLLIKEDVFPVNKFWINNVLQDYYYEITNPCYAYYLGYNNTDLWEVYRPLESKYNKFRTNNTNDLKELYKISSKNNLIITKSKKDLMLLKRLLLDTGIIDTDVLYMSEGNKLKTSTKIYINQHYKNVFINFDIDITGINTMKLFNKLYGYSLFPFIPSNIPDISNYPKDISDFCKKYGYNNTLKLFNYLYNHYVL